MLRNGVERKKNYAIIFVRSNNKIFEFTVSFEQLELLEKLGGKVRLVREEQPILYVDNSQKHIYLKTLFFGYDGIIFKNGDSLDFRPDNIGKKQFDLEGLLKELEVN
ncbi:hypothetical protein J2Y03_001196 [Neobacillus niacini]|uniref:hypothetical protein n=1 Tax=Neobacillus niacini TaxID=86668 RepID=UPI00286594A7|nr:hypothetical protein [Neobacillus niacini]MDR7076193.1 hypothetical protein [Neobacillus niacini]